MKQNTDKGGGAIEGNGITVCFETISLYAVDLWGALVIRKRRLLFYEDKCITSLSSYSGTSKLSPKDLFDIAVVVALREAQNVVSLVSNLTQKITDPMQKEAFRLCGAFIFKNWRNDFCAHSSL